MPRDAVKPVIAALQFKIRVANTRDAQPNQREPRWTLGTSTCLTTICLESIKTASIPSQQLAASSRFTSGFYCRRNLAASIPPPPPALPPPPPPPNVRASLVDAPRLPPTLDPSTPGRCKPAPPDCPARRHLFLRNRTLWLSPLNRSRKMFTLST